MLRMNDRYRAMTLERVTNFSMKASRNATKSVQDVSIDDLQLSWCRGDGAHARESALQYREVEPIDREKVHSVA